MVAPCAMGPMDMSAYTLGLSDPPGDILTLVASLRRQVLLRLTEVLGEPLCGISLSARRLPISSKWRRKLRELDCTLGFIEKVSGHSVRKFMADLDAELNTVQDQWPSTAAKKAQASASSPADAPQLTALVQVSARTDESDLDVGALFPEKYDATCSGHPNVPESENIIDVPEAEKQNVTSSIGRASSGKLTECGSPGWWRISKWWRKPRRSST